MLACARLLINLRIDNELNRRLIGGDIGGTKTILQLAELSGGKVSERLTRRYDSTQFSDFQDILQDFLDQAGTAGYPHAACFAVAGPVTGRQAKLTNLPWQLSSHAIATEFSIPSVKLINDFEAVALAVENLPSADLLTLQAGQEQPQATRVVLGAGTGMGVAWLPWWQGRYHALPTEAGHIDFAPVTPLQIRLLEALQMKFGHVSVERLLSGAGLTHIFKFLQSIAAVPSGGSVLEEDSGAAIAALALDRNDPVAIQALELFAEIYGAYAGNLALAGLCRGGVYLAGGIAPKIAGVLRAGGFIAAFRAKGRFSAFMSGIPVHIITNPHTGLLGARQEAQRLLDQDL